VNNPIGVAIFQGQQKLVDNGLDLFLIQNDSLEVFFEITVHILKDKVQLVLSRNHLFEVDYVRVIELLKK